MEHLLYLLLLHSVCHLFAMGGNDKLELWKGKKIKSFIVQFDRLYPGVSGDGGGHINNGASTVFCTMTRHGVNKVRV